MLTAAELDQVETRIRDMGFYPYRTTDEELDEIWDNPEAVHAVFLDLMRETLGRWMDLAAERLAGHRDPAVRDDRQRRPAGAAGQMLRDSPVLIEPEDGLIDLGEGITMISCG